MFSSTPKRAAEFKNVFGRFRYLTILKAVDPVGILRVTESGMPLLITSPTEALADWIDRDPGFRSMAEVARWMEGIRIDIGDGLDWEELSACAEHCGRPSTG